MNPGRHMAISLVAIGLLGPPAAWPQSIRGRVDSAQRSGSSPVLPELHGVYKHFLALTDVHDNFQNLGLTDYDVAVDDLQRLRLQLAYAPRDEVEFTLHYEARAAWGERVRIRQQAEEGANLDARFAGNSLFREPRRRFFDFEDTFVRESTFVFSHALDRFRLRLGNRKAELSVGRQAVSWGSGLIWTPLDLFAGFAPNEIDRDFKLGVDVMRVMVSPAFGTSLDLIAEPLDDDATWSIDPADSSLAARATGHWGEYDLALVAGQVAGDAVIGGDWSGYLGHAGFRGEWSYSLVDESAERDYFRGVLSVDYSFAAAWDPYLALEYHFNGLGEDDPDDYLPRLQEDSVRRVFDRGTVFNIGRNYLGSVVRLVPSALLTLSATTLWNLDDGSALEFATLTRSLSESVDLIVGANFGIGPLGTEFGGFSREQAGADFGTPDLYYAFLKLYF